MNLTGVKRTAPYASNVNDLAAGLGRATSNAAVVATDSEGRVCVTTSATVDVVVGGTATFTV